MYSKFLKSCFLQDYTMQLLYRQTWFDSRLKSKTSNVEYPTIVGDEYHAKRIWTPSIHAVNNKDVGTFGGEIDLLQIDPNIGKVLLCRR